MLLRDQPMPLTKPTFSVNVYLRTSFLGRVSGIFPDPLKPMVHSSGLALYRQYLIPLRCRMGLASPRSIVQPLSAMGFQGPHSVHEGSPAEAVTITSSIYMRGRLISELLQARRHSFRSAPFADSDEPSRNALCVVI